MATITRARPRTKAARGKASTTARPSPRSRSTPPATPGPMTVAQRDHATKQVITNTKRKATRMLSDKDANRSTATQRAQRAKAKAFDEIALIHSGRG